MNEPITTLKKFNEMEQRVAQLERGSGSGYNGGMDAWQTSVESRLTYLVEAVSRIEVKLATMPDKWFIVVTALATATLVLGAVVLGYEVHTPPSHR